MRWYLNLLIEVYENPGLGWKIALEKQVTTNFLWRTLVIPLLITHFLLGMFRCVILGYDIPFFGIWRVSMWDAIEFYFWQTAWIFCGLWLCCYGLTRLVQRTHKSCNSNQIKKVIILAASPLLISGLFVLFTDDLIFKIGLLLLVWSVWLLYTGLLELLQENRSKHNNLSQQAILVAILSFTLPLMVFERMYTSPYSLETFSQAPILPEVYALNKSFDRLMKLQPTRKVP